MIFREQSKILLEDGIGTAVDDRRHTTVTHLGRAMSVRDLREKVKSRCPDGTKNPGLDCSFGQRLHMLDRRSTTLGN